MYAGNANDFSENQQKGVIAMKNSSMVRDNYEENIPDWKTEFLNGQNNTTNTHITDRTFD